MKLYAISFYSILQLLFLYGVKYHQVWGLSIIIISILCLCNTGLYSWTIYRGPGYYISQANNHQNRNSLRQMTSNDNCLRHYCQNCQQYQLYRMKHCKQCELCVATYDHHCNFMVICIGQKNRPIFYSYLLTLMSELIISLGSIINVMIKNRNKSGQSIFFITMMCITLILALTMAIFQTFLIFKNFTTWEILTKQHLSYMRKPSYQTQFQQTEENIDQQYQNQAQVKIFYKYSPFNRGCINNFKQFYSISCKKDLHQWQIK